MVIIKLIVMEINLSKIFIVINKRNIMYCFSVIWLAFITSAFSTYVMKEIVIGLFNINIFLPIIHLLLCIPSFSILERVFYGIYI